MADEETQPNPESDPEADAGATGDAAATDVVDDGAEASADDAVASPGDGAYELPEIDGTTGSSVGEAGMQLLDDVELDVQVELGRSRMYVEDVLKLGPDAVIELDKAAGDPVDIYVNRRHVARGEVLVLNDSFCVRISEIIQETTNEE